MGKYLLRRILQMIPVVLGTTLLVYALVFALPGDPVKAMFGDKPVNEAVAAQIRAEYHLDQPFIVQYFIYLKNALTLNFGDTFAGQPVLDEITRAFPVTIRLGLMAFVFEAIFGVVFGIISGLKKGKWYDHKVSVTNAVLKEDDAAAPAETLADGTYTIAVTLEGGSGKANIQSPCTLTVADGKMTATIVWSSSHYDYMLVDGERCDVLSTENGSTFEIPVAALDTPLAVVGDTTAMSTPHEIDYALTFDASSAEVNG